MLQVISYQVFLRRMIYIQLYGCKYSYLILVIIWFQVIKYSKTNDLHTVVWLQVFLSNTSNYMVSGNYFHFGLPHMAEQKQDDKHKHTFSSYVRIRDVVQKICQRRWTIGKSGERGSGISVLPARNDDDDDELFPFTNNHLFAHGFK